MPFNNMQELYDSDYELVILPGTSRWDAFKYGNALWQRIYKDKLEPFEEEFNYLQVTENEMKWIMENERRAVSTESLYVM